MALTTFLGFVGATTVSQTASALLVMNMVNAAVSITAGAVLTLQGVYFGGRLVYQVVETASGYLIKKINDLRASNLPLDEYNYSRVETELGDFKLLEPKKQEIVELKIQTLNPEIFNALDPDKLYRIIK